MLGNDTEASGYVYILESPATNYIKIGGTGICPMKRVQEINMTEPYKSLGPWHLTDFRQVADWRLVEHFLHKTFLGQRVYEIEGQKELFSASAIAAHNRLNQIEPEQLIGKPKVDRMFMDDPFREYLIWLFAFTGLAQWMDYQGAWTLSLFPSTNCGRYFTLNIASHEVAYSNLSHRNVEQRNMLYMDDSILSQQDTMTWLENHQGEWYEDSYTTALPRGVSILIPGGFHVIREFMAQQGVRRAVLAYWTESLLVLKQNDRTSTYARWHNYNAVATIWNSLKSSTQ